MGKHKVGAVFLAGVLAMGTVMTGCSGKDETEGKTGRSGAERIFGRNDCSESLQHVCDTKGCG